MSADAAAAVAAERTRIAEVLHRDAVQAIAAAAMQTDLLCTTVDDPEVAAQLQELRETLGVSVRALRELLTDLREAAG